MEKNKTSKKKNNVKNDVVKKSSLFNKTKKANQEKLIETKKRNKIKYRTDEQKEMIHFLVVILVVLVCCGLIYLCTRAFITKDLFKKEDETKVKELVEGKINYDVAIFGTMLNGPYDEYYVFIYDAENGDYIAKMSSLVSQYKSKDSAKHVYTVNLANKLNDGHYDPEHASTEFTNIPDFKVGDITLVKVRKGSMNKIITDYEQMQKELGITSK